MLAVDGGSHGNSFRKQMMALKDAYVPGADNRSEAIRVVRHEAEIGYTKAAKSLLATVVMAQMPPSPLAKYVVMDTPFIGRSGFRPPHQLVTAHRFHRTKTSGLFVGWYED
eukprot:contig_3844_g841